MKLNTLCCAAFIVCCAGTATAQNSAATIVVDKGETTTMSGLAGDATISYAFAKGDHITILADASKKLAYMRAIKYPDAEISRAKETKHVDRSFDMTEDGIVLITFISDRGGRNTIHYTISRKPASAATQNYVTKVNWEKPTDHVGALIPKQATAR